MIPGLNTNVNHAGAEYHVQTEDLGQENPYVLTLVFREGAIIAREKVNYGEALGDGASEAQVKRFMDQQHQRIIQTIQSLPSQQAAAPQRVKESPSRTKPSPPKSSLPSVDESLEQLIMEYLRSRQADKQR